MPEMRSTTLRMVRGLLQIPETDQIVFDSDITDTMVFLAIAEYSRRRPRKAIADYIGNGESNYQMPTYWSDEFSVLEKIYLGGSGFLDEDSEVDKNEYRVVGVDTTVRSLSAATIGASQVTLSPVTAALYFKDGDVVEIKASSASSGETNWVSADGVASSGVVALLNAIAATYATPVIRKKKFFRFTRFTMTSSDTFRVHYTGLHIHSDSESTIPDGDYASYCHLVAALTAYSIAAQFSQGTHPSIEADAVDQDTLAGLWKDRGDEQYKLFGQNVGEIVEGEGGPPAGSFFGDMDRHAIYNKDFLTHPSRRR